MAIKVMKGDLPKLNLTFELEEHNEVVLYNTIDGVQRVRTKDAIEELEELLRILKAR